MKSKNISARLLTAALVLVLCHAACGGGPAAIENSDGRASASPALVSTPAAAASVTPSPEASASPTATPGGGATPEPGEPAAQDFQGTVGVAEKEGAGEPALLRAVRTASHEQYDRVVFEFGGARVPGYHVEYVDRPVRQCGSGEAVPVAGDAWLRVRLTPANAHTEQGEATVKDRSRRLGYANLKELKSLCDFEAEVEWVLGLASPTRYRVLELANPARLVIDVKKP
jgi:hypothetical protein